MKPQQNAENTDNGSTGHAQLWLWFGLSRASWLTLPRVMMHEMPDEWQAKMAALLEQWDATWTNPPDIETCVQIRQEGKFVATPEFLVNYRHPDYEALSGMKRTVPGLQGSHEKD